MIVSPTKTTTDLVYNSRASARLTGDNEINQSRYSGSEAKAHPFTGVDEADDWEPTHESALFPEFYIQPKQSHDHTEAVQPPE